METRMCFMCGEIWTDTGELECPFCGSLDTSIIDDPEDETEDG